MSYFWPFTHGIITHNTNHRIIVYLCRAIQQVRHLGRGTENEESNRKLYRTKEGVQSKKVISLAQILLYTFFCDSIFPSWFLMKLWWYYSEEEVEHIQERAYQYIWNNYIINTEKYHNFTYLSMWVVYTYIHVPLKIKLYLKMWFSTSFDITWYGEASIYTKNLFLIKTSFSHSIVS